MTIQELITRPGVWEANPEASFHYREALYQVGIMEEEADKIVAATTGTKFMFRDTMLWHYGETPFGQVVFAKLYFHVDELDKSIKMYAEASLQGDVVLTFDIQEIDEKRVVFFVEENEIYFVCDYTENKRKFPEE